MLHIDGSFFIYLCLTLCLIHKIYLHENEDVMLCLNIYCVKFSFKLKIKTRNDKVRERRVRGGGGGDGGLFLFQKSKRLQRRWVCVPPLQTCTNKVRAGVEKKIILCERNNWMALYVILLVIVWFNALFTLLVNSFDLV